ncbi:MAG: aldo/keto reductase [Planctomycetota bacterium]|jgi:aryl-alcohol dehydrogenase-like predicted oxidoreductase
MAQRKHKKVNRRNFLKTIGAAGLGSVFAPHKVKANPNEPNAPGKDQGSKFPQVPGRKLGKTGIDIPCLSLGTNRLDNQIILRNALEWGVSYWDTANSYVGGNSELNIGKYLTKNPEVRKELFIVSKASGAQKEPTPKAVVAKVQERLQTSLKRMNTKYIDLYYGVHGLEDTAQLTDELKQWVNNAKKQGVIRYFGFSTHKNMAQNLSAAARLDWIDAIMTTYNFRLMQDDKMQASIEECYKAGIGIIAMKTLGRRSGHEVETEEDKKLVMQFLQGGFTDDQAKIKAVLANERISSACVGTNNVAHFVSNVAATIDKTNLSQADIAALREYADATCNGYCAGCAHICDAALPDVPYISDIMRYLMYYNSYGEHDRARQLFAQIPEKVRSKLFRMDYSLAEVRCPQHLPIGELVAEAVSKLA